MILKLGRVDTFWIVAKISSIPDSIHVIQVFHERRAYRGSLLQSSTGSSFRKRHGGPPTLEIRYADGG